MTESEFIKIKEKVEVFEHTSMEYIEHNDIPEYKLLISNEKLILILGYNTEGKYYEYHWAANEPETLLEHLDCKETYVITFIPQDWVQRLEAAGIQVRSAWHDYFLKELDSIDSRIYENGELLTMHECKDASDVTQSCVGVSRGFTGQTAKWFEDWISSTNPAANNTAVFVTRTPEEKIIGIVCTGTYAHDSEKGPIVWIREAAVNPAYQNKGIARKLILQALSYGKHHGAKRAFLAVDENNTNAIHLYTSLGFLPSASQSQIDMIKYKN